MRPAGSLEARAKFRLVVFVPLSKFGPQPMEIDETKAGHTKPPRHDSQKMPVPLQDRSYAYHLDRNFHPAPRTCLQNTWHQGKRL
jgi:hypothetical protein